MDFKGLSGGVVVGVAGGEEKKGLEELELLSRVCWLNLMVFLRALSHELLYFSFSIRDGST